MSPDVNVLVAASRSDHPQHAVARAWIDEALTAARSGASFALLPMVATGMVRVVTHERVFPDPTPPRQALAFVRALLARPGVEMLTLGTEWRSVERICTEHRLKGNAVPDAWIASAIIDHHEHLVTFDRTFRRFLPASQVTVLRP